jgi:hypothetical protein
MPYVNVQGEPYPAFFPSGPSTATTTCGVAGGGAGGMGGGATTGCGGGLKEA